MNATPDPPRDRAADRKAALGRVYDEHGEKLRYLIVGMINTAIGYAVFIILLAVLGPPLQSLVSSSSRLIAWIGEHYYVAVQWIGWVFMVPVSTTTMKRFAFRSPGSWSRQVFRAYFVYLPAQALSSLLLWLTVRVLGLSPQIGQLVTIAFATVFSYIGHKYFTFRLPLEVGEVPDPDVMGEIAEEPPAAER